MSEAKQYGRTMLHMVATPPLFGLAHPAFTYCSVFCGAGYFLASIVLGDPSPVAMLMLMGVLQFVGITLTRIDPDYPTLWLAHLRMFRSLQRESHYAG